MAITSKRDEFTVEIHTPSEITFTMDRYEMDPFVIRVTPDWFVAMGAEKVRDTVVSFFASVSGKDSQDISDRLPFYVHGVQANAFGRIMEQLASGK